MQVFPQNRNRHDRYRMRHALRSGVVSLMAVLIFSTPAVSDIYKYVDENGVLHFSNSPDTSRHRLYIRERPTLRTTIRSTSRYDKVIWEASKAYDVAFPLIKAIIKTESDFNPWAISSKGAKGLMQIMPDNFGMLNISDPFNPRQNIMGGTRYLKQMLNRFHGRLPLALAAYNAGPTAVSKYQGIPPYTETRNYVKRVMNHYNRYKVRSS